MHQHFQRTIVFLGCTSLVFSLATSVAWAGPFREVVDECKKKSRMGDSFCMSIIRNNLTVPDCVKQTGFSEAECEVKIQAIKEDPEFSGTSSSVTPQTPMRKSAYSQMPVSGVESSRVVGTLAELRTKKERDLLALQERTQLLMGTLRKYGVELKEIEAALPEFERRSEVLLAAYDTYQSVYAGTARDAATARTTMRSKAQEPLDQAIRDLVEYYQQKILMPLRGAVERAL